MKICLYGGCSNRIMIPNTHQNSFNLWFDTNKITAIQWAAQSPGQNPIENLWKQLDDKVHLQGRFRNAKELYEELQTV